MTMVVLLVNFAATTGGGRALFGRTAAPGSASVLLTVGRHLFLYLALVRSNALGSYSVYLEEVLAVLVIILAHTAVQAQSKAQVRVNGPKAVMAALFNLFAQPVYSLAGQITEHGHLRQHRQANHLSPFQIDQL